MSAREEVAQSADTLMLKALVFLMVLGFLKLQIKEYAYANYTPGSHGIKTTL
jgi:hypothetical protein